MLCGVSILGRFIYIGRKEIPNLIGLSQRVDPGQEQSMKQPVRRF